MSNSSAQWQLKGNSPKIYDKYISPAVSAPWYSLFIETGLSYMQGSIVDIGCGTGSFLFHLLNQKKISNETELVGIDINSAMLDIAKNKSSIAKNSISWINADVKKIPFSDAYFNLMYCQQGIQYFKDKDEALREMYRVMNPNGVFIATVWSTIENCIGYKCLADAVQRVVGDSAKSSLYSPFSYHNPENFKELVKSAGFSSVDVKTINNFVSFPSIKEFSWYRIYGSPLIDDLPKNNIENIMNEIILELESSLKPYQGNDGLSFPVKANYLIARK